MWFLEILWAGFVEVKNRILWKDSGNEMSSSSTWVKYIPLLVWRTAQAEGACSLLAFTVHPHDQRREEFPALPAGCLLYAHHLCGEFAQKLRWTVKLSFLAFTCFASLTVRILAKLKYFLLPVSIQAFCYL